MANRRPVLPEETRYYRLTVARVGDVSPSFRRITVTSDELADFAYLGYDHWFRLFIPAADHQAWRLPSSTSKLWFAQWLAIRAKARPHVNNYTVRDFRADVRELDIDIVLHRGDSGALEGRVAQWASEVRPGDDLAILDQGLLFNRPAECGSVVLAGDESALPAIEGILRSLPAEIGGRAVIEVPTRSDVRELTHGPAIELHWVVRAEVDPAAVAGAAALAATCALPAPAPDTYAFLAGESGLVTGARRHLVQAGLPKDQITFTGLWKSPTHHRQPAAAH